MAEDGKNFVIEQSTLEYLTSREVRVATDSLLNSGTDELPPGMSWDDVPRFYSALRAATLIKIEYALTLELFWKSVWDGAIDDTHWRELTPDAQGEHDSDAENSIDECFDQERFTRCFKAKASKHILYAYVEISEAGLSIGFDLHKGNLPRQLVQDLEEFQFKRGDGLWTDAAKVKVSKSPDLTELRSLAHSAAKAAWQRVPEG